MQKIDSRESSASQRKGDTPLRGMSPSRQEISIGQQESLGSASSAQGFTKGKGGFNSAMLTRAVVDSFSKLNPKVLWKNPVMFVVEITAILTTFFSARDIVSGQVVWFDVQIAAWLWITVLFANFAEALAEGRGKAQADALRRTRSETQAKKLTGDHTESIPSSQLRKGDMVLVEVGDFIPGDGEVIEGIASVDESAITGESAPVIRESGGDRSSVTGGTRVLSDWIKVRITANPGETFLDRMIHLVEGAKRQKTPNEIALTILLLGLTIIFLLAVATLEPFAIYSGALASVPVLAALLVCLIPTTIGGLVTEWLGEVPPPGAAVERDGLRLEVLAADALRVIKVRILRAPEFDDQPAELA